MKKRLLLWSSLFFASAVVLSVTIGGWFLLQALHDIEIRQPYGDVSSYKPGSIVPDRAPESSLLSKLTMLWRPQPQVVRTVGVMIENHESARPHQLGLDKALMVQEWLVEGLISRFIVLYDLNNLPPETGPVRSVRPYFITGALPWTNYFVHAGGSPEAIELLYETASGAIGVNGLTGAHYGHFERDNDIAPPHNLFVSGSYLLSFGSGSGVPSRIWPPYETVSFVPEAARSATRVDIEFYNRLHDVTYNYDQTRQLYVRTNGLVEAQASPVNVLLLEIPIADQGELGRLDIPIGETGNVLLFSHGKIFPGYWQKPTDGMWSFVDTDGNPLPLTKGQTWLTVLPTLNRVSWE